MAEKRVTKIRFQYFSVPFGLGRWPNIQADLPQTGLLTHVFQSNPQMI